MENGKSMRQIISIFLIAYLMKMAAFAQEPIDYQKMADETSWVWKDEAANPFSFSQLHLGDLNYEVVFRVKPRVHGSRDSKSIEFRKNGVVRAEIPWAVFSINGDRLTYVLDQDGGTAIQIDLNTSKERWRTTLMDIPVMSGTLGMKRFNLETPNDLILRVWVLDGNTRCFEVLRLETGELLGSKVFATVGPETQDMKKRGRGMGDASGTGGKVP